jgi:Tol biopolymer transport system component
MSLQLFAQRSCALFFLCLIAIVAVPAQADKPAKASDKKGAEFPDKKKEEKLPLKPARKVEFTTEEGTWLSLDASPDGKNIIFDLVGDLYTLPVTGGEAKKLTSGMGFNSQPHYSPDGNFIAFVSDRGGSENIWISKPDGTEAKQLSQDEQVEFATPSWTPDSQYVIAARESQFPIQNFELWMYHVKGGAGVQITKFRAKPDANPREWTHTLSASASRDGRYLYYTTRSGFFDKVYNVSFPLSQIARSSPTHPAAPSARSSRPTETSSFMAPVTKPKPDSACAT